MNEGLSIDLLVLVLCEIPFPRILLLRRVSRKWDNTINENSRFQGPYLRYRMREIEKRVVSWNNSLPESVWDKWINLSIDQGLDPSADGIWAIRCATNRGHLPTVRRLLQDPRVDPSAENNILIYIAATHGHLEIVKLLLLDSRVDPSVDENVVILAAAKHGHLDVIEYLLQDPRVDPTILDCAIQWSTYYGHTGIAELLKNHNA